MNLKSSTLLLWLCLAVPPVLATDTTTQAAITVDELEQVYDGAPKVPSATTDPPGLPVRWEFIKPVFDRIQNPLFLSYISISLIGNNTCALGDFVQLGGTARHLEAVDVVLVTWAKASQFPDLATADPTGWDHPVTLTIYDYNETTSEFTFLSEVTQDIHVPWRPLTRADGSPYPYNGYAFIAHFDFPPGITLPDKTMLMVSYNTKRSGFEPIGEPGPYDQLNVAVGGRSPTVGSDVDPNALLWVKSPTEWYYPAESAPPPMFRVFASDETPPVDAGVWPARAIVDDPNYAGVAGATFTVLPATAMVQLEDLKQVADGTAKPATVVTDPPSLPANVTYNGSRYAPSRLGTYAVHAEVADPNYTGSADGTLIVGHNLESWMNQWTEDEVIPPETAGPENDPDHDGIVNLLEYAFGLDPSSGTHPTEFPGTPGIELQNGEFSLVFRKNRLATDLSFVIETATTLDDPAAWTPATFSESTISSENWVDTIRARISLPPDTPRIFARVRVNRN